MKQLNIGKGMSILIAAILCVGVFSSIGSASQLLTWNFTAEIFRIHGDQSLIPTGNTFAIDQIISGSIAYQSDLTTADTGPTTDDHFYPVYPPAYFTASEFTTRTNWDNYEVSVNHQSSRDVANVKMFEYDDGNEIIEELQLVYYDRTETFFPEDVLPTNWHTVPINPPSGDGDFHFYYDIYGDGESHARIYADIVSIELVRPVPEPATMLLFGIGLLSLAGVSRREK